MQKFFFSLVLVFTFSFGAFGASSDDVYMRQDVLKERDRALIAEIRAMNMELRRDFEKEFARFEKEFARIDRQFEQIRGEIKELSTKVNIMDSNLNKRIDNLDSSVNKRIDDTHNFFYLIIVMLGFIIAIPFVQKWLDKQKLKTEQIQEKSIPQITPDYIKKLINETLAETLKANNLIVQRN